MRVVILRGRVSIGPFCQGECCYLRNVVRITCIFFFSLFQIHLFLYMSFVTIIDIHCTYFLYMLMYVFFTYPYMCCFFSLFIHILLITCMQSIISVSHKDALMSFFFLKCFRNISYPSLLAINSLLAKFFKSLCQDKFYCNQQVNMS